MNDSLRGRQVVLSLTNQTGGGVVAGDVVVVSATVANAFAATVIGAYSDTPVGVALETIAAGAVGRIAFFGYVPTVNLTSAAALSDFLFTATEAKHGAPLSTDAEGSFGQALGTGAAPAAFLWGRPSSPPGGGVGGNVATDSIWDAKGDLAVGTGADAASKLTAGVDGKYLTTLASEATGLKWGDLPGAKGCTVRRTTAQTINTSGQISFDTEERDDDGYWTVGSPTRLTIPNTGWYMMTVQVSWSTGTSAKNTTIRLDGTTELVHQGPTTTASFYQNAAWVGYFTAGQYLELHVIATADVLAAAFSIARILS